MATGVRPLFPFSRVNTRKKEGEEEDRFAAGERK